MSGETNGILTFVSVLAIFRSLSSETEAFLAPILGGKYWIDLHIGYNDISHGRLPTAVFIYEHTRASEVRVTAGVI